MVPLKIKLPDEFLKEETQWGYTITKEMKKVWAVQLDLLSELDRICRKYDIYYIASGGTLLGAIRHHGFIPWDDDLDLMLPRDGYNRLCAVVEGELNEPYFFQTEYTDPGFMRGFARLRNSQTTGIQKFEFSKRYRFNQGIFIDIFPMDEVVSDYDIFDKQKHKARQLFSKACILSEMTDRFPPNSRPRWKYLYKTAGHYLFGRLISGLRLQDYYLKQFEHECSKYNGTGQSTWSLLSFQFDNRHHDLPVYNDSEIMYVDFEFMKIPIPNNYHEHLTIKYGDYMNPKRVPNYHGDVIFDTDRSYLDVLGL